MNKLLRNSVNITFLVSNFPEVFHLVKITTYKTIVYIKSTCNGNQLNLISCNNFISLSVTRFSNNFYFLVSSTVVNTFVSTRIFHIYVIKEITTNVPFVKKSMMVNIILF